jgi:ABC-type nitrate/sulfonate/bicarbonate transport system substrate-binding protein
MNAMPLRRRRLLARACGLWAPTTLPLAALGQSAGERGWPRPYRPVSAASVQALKRLNLWPLSFGWQPAFSGQNNTVAAMLHNGLLTRRGVEMNFVPLPNGGAVNTALIDGRVQLGAIGNFPLTLLIDQQVPVKVVAITAPNLKHQTIVKRGSPYRKLEDFRGAKPAVTVGLVQGSSAEFYFQASAAAVNVKVGYDVTIKNVPLGEQRQALATLDAVVPWDPMSTLIAADAGNRAIDVSYPYNVYQGSIVLRDEVIAAAPDVALALVESLLEAELWLRANPDKALAAMTAMPAFKALPPALLAAQIKEYNLLYKPTYMYPLGRFWGRENQDIALWLKLNGRIKRHLERAEYERNFAPQFMQAAFATLGWRVPTLPPFIAPDWPLKSKGKVLAPYGNPLTLKAPQPWPEPADLVNSAPAVAKG